MNDSAGEQHGGDGKPQTGKRIVKTVLIILIALLLLVGAVVGVLLLSPAAAPATKPTVVLGDPVRGKQVAMRADVNCVFCHSDDDSIMIGPSFKGMWGSTVTYEDGSTGLIDDAEVRAALKAPNARIIRGFEPRMPEGLDQKMSADDMTNLLAYLRSIGAGK